MNLRVLYGSLGIVCVIILGIGGMGWKFEEEGRRHPPAPKQVFCDVEKLAPYHPAWGQLVQVRAMLSRSNQPGRLDDEAGTTVSRGLSGDWREPESVSESRAALQSKLEEKAREELSKIGSQLNQALDRRLVEKQQELDAEAKAAEAEARRSSEQQLATDLRALNEDQKFDQVDAAIKLSALKSQLGVDGLVSDKVKQAISERESELNGIKSKLAEREDELRLKIASQAAEAGEDLRRSAEKELAAIRDEESGRINGLLRSKNDRLRDDLEKNGFRAAQEALSNNGSAAAFYAGLEKKAAQARAAAASDFSNAAINGVDDLVALERSLRVRIRTELEAVVKRTARQSNLQVVFENNRKAENRTDWFRERLPYLPDRE